MPVVTVCTGRALAAGVGRFLTLRSGVYCAKVLPSSGGLLAATGKAVRVR